MFVFADNFLNFDKDTTTPAAAVVVTSTLVYLGTNGGGGGGGGGVCVCLKSGLGDPPNQHTLHSTATRERCVQQNFVMVVDALGGVIAPKCFRDIIEMINKFEKKEGSFTNYTTVLQQMCPNNVCLKRLSLPLVGKMLNCTYHGVNVFEAWSDCLEMVGTTPRCTDLLNEHIRPSLLLVFDIMHIQVSEFIFTDVCMCVIVIPQRKQCDRGKYSDHH